MLYIIIYSNLNYSWIFSPYFMIMCLETCVEHNNYLYMQFNIQITKQLYNSNFSHLK